MDLDDLLTRSAPPVATRTPDLDAQLRGLAAATEHAARPRKRGLRLVAATTATVAVVAAGGAAAASGLLPEWMPWSTSTGRACEASYSVTMAGPDGGPLTPDVAAMSTAEKQRVVDAANTFLATFDYDTVDLDAAIDRWRTDEAVIRASAGPGERQPKLSGTDLEITATSQEVSRRLDAALTAQGLDMDAVVFASGWRCRK